MPAQATSINISVVLYTPNQSVKDRHLVRARVRSHAATASHHTKKRQPRVSVVELPEQPLQRYERKDSSEPHPQPPSAVAQLCSVPSSPFLDPFQTSPNGLTRDIQQGITYWTQASSWGCVPPTGRTNMATSIAQLSAETVLRQLLNPSIAAGIIFENAALTSHLLPGSQFELVRLQYKQETVQILRQNIEAREADNWQPLLDLMLSALEAALCEPDRREAELHALQVQHILSTRSDNLKPWLLLKLGRVYFIDSLFAQKRGIPVSLKEEHLPLDIQTIIQRIRSQSQPCTDMLRAKLSKELPWLSPDVVKPLMGWLHTLRVTGAPRKDLDAACKLAQPLYIALSTGVRFIGPAFKALDVREKLLGDESYPDSRRPKLRIESIILATTVLHMCMCNHIIKPMGQAAIDNRTADKLRTHLNTAMQGPQKSSFASKKKQQHQQQIDEIMLWALYKAACWEITYTSHHGASFWQDWFVDAFRRQAMKLHIAGWDELKDVVGRWVPTGVVHPAGEHWVDELLLGCSVSKVKGSDLKRCWKPGCPE